MASTALYRIVPTRWKPLKPKSLQRTAKPLNCRPRRKVSHRLRTVSYRGCCTQRCALLATCPSSQWPPSARPVVPESLPGDRLLRPLAPGTNDRKTGRSCAVAIRKPGHLILLPSACALQRPPAIRATPAFRTHPFEFRERICALKNGALSDHREKKCPTPT